MVYQCCVPLCDNECRDGISMNFFPLDPKVHDKWKKALEKGGEIQFPEATRMVCSAHFKPSDFFKNSHKRGRLKSSAVPSIFVWTQEEQVNRSKMDSEPRDTINCGEILPESVEISNCQDLIKEEEPLIPHSTSHNLLEDPLEATDIIHEPIGNPRRPIQMNSDLLKSTEHEPIKVKISKQNSVKKDLLGSTKHVPVDMKIIKQNTIKRNLPVLESTKHVPIQVKRFKYNTANVTTNIKNKIFNGFILKPNTDPLASTVHKEKVFKHELEVTDTFLTDSLASTKYILPTVDNEFIKIVDIQDIVNQKSNQPEVSEMGTDTPVSSNVTSFNNVTLQPTIDNTGVSKSSNLYVPKNENVKSLPDQAELTDLDIVKNGACLRCKECKRIVSDITSAKQHTCPPRDNNFKCTICNSSFLSVSDLQNHLALEHPTVPTFQNTVGKLFLPNTSSSQNFLISQMPEIGQHSIFSQFELIKIASINTTEKDVEKSSSKKKYNNCISKAHEELYKHFCQSHLNIDDNVTLKKTVFLPPKSGDTFHCPHCPKVFKTRDNFSTHLSIYHINSCTYQCRTCRFIQICRLDQFLEHSCTRADDYLIPHRLYQCKICETLSNENSSLKEQKYRDHCFYFKKFKITRTNIPNDGVYFRYALKLPTKRYKAPKGFRCFCSDIFETQVELNRHLESHVDCVFRKCSKCNLDCENMYVYYKHVEQAHRSKLLDDLDFRNRRVTWLSKKNLEFACENQDCKETFINNCSVQLHIRQQHTSHLGLHTIDMMELKCPICEVVFLDQKLFYAHCVPYTPLVPELGDVQQPDYRFWCKICKMSQNSVKDLDHHVVKEHNVSMIHCMLCKSNFVCEKQAFSHFNSCYSKTSQLNCPICGRIGLSLNSMINHIRNELRIKPYQQCKFCLNFFYGKFNLALHMMNAKCNLCDLYFCNVKNLAEHRKVVHECNARRCKRRPQRLVESM